MVTLILIMQPFVTFFTLAVVISLLVKIKIKRKDKRKKYSFSVDSSMDFASYIVKEAKLKLSCEKSILN